VILNKPFFSSVAVSNFYSVTRYSTKQWTSLYGGLCSLLLSRAGLLGVIRSILCECLCVLESRFFVQSFNRTQSTKYSNSQGRGRR